MRALHRARVRRLPKRWPSPRARCPSRHRGQSGADLAGAVLRAQEEHAEHADDELIEVETDEDPHERIG